MLCCCDFRNQACAAYFDQVACAAAGRARGTRAGKRSGDHPSLERFTLGVVGDQLVASRDLSRQNAEFVDVPITDKHLDPGQYFLTAAPSLRVTSLFG